MAAVFPGSFNPPTVAHIAIVDAVLARHRMERLDLVISKIALAKETALHPPMADRVRVVRESVADRPEVAVRVTDDQLLVDIARGYDLLVVGADKWAQIQEVHWYGSEAERDRVMAALPPLAVFPRGDIEIPPEIRLDLTGFEHVSSTRARSGAVELMTPAAARYATENGVWLDRRPE